MIGTSRDHIDAASYRRIVDILIANEIDTVLFNGGNGSMDTAGKIAREIQKRNRPIRVIGIPKTIDNDIAVSIMLPALEAPLAILLLPFRSLPPMWRLCRFMSR